MKAGFLRRSQAKRIKIRGSAFRAASFGEAGQIVAAKPAPTRRRTFGAPHGSAEERDKWPREREKNRRPQREFERHVPNTRIRRTRYSILVYYQPAAHVWEAGHRIVDNGVIQLESRKMKGMLPRIHGPRRRNALVDGHSPLGSRDAAIAQLRP